MDDTPTKTSDDGAKVIHFTIAMTTTYYIQRCKTTLYLNLLITPFLESLVNTGIKHRKLVPSPATIVSVLIGRRQAVNW